MILLLTAAALATGCVVVQGDQILASELARAIPGFSELPAELPLRFGPAPGIRLLLTQAEQRRLARIHSLAFEPEREICVERAMRALEQNEIGAAMRQVLGARQVELEILDYMRTPVPLGRLEFPISGLPTPADPTRILPLIWRGHIRYGDSKTLPVWARVKVFSTVPQVVAAENLPAGKAIGAAQIRLQPAKVFPFTTAGFASCSAVTGRAPARPIRAGTRILATMLTEPVQIEAGDTVRVEVRSGEARLTLSARAQTSGRAGDVVTLRNLSTGRKFPARVQGKGEAIVDADDDQLAVRLPAGPAGGGTR